MPAEFKYFGDPEAFAAVLDGEHECEICHQTGRCFDGSQYYGEEEYTAFCFDCVSAGRLVEVEAFAVDPDVGALKQQLQELSPGASPDEIEERAAELTGQLAGTTPKFPTWQDWFWPAHCGDYCQFARLAGQADFHKLAEDGDGKALFASSLYPDLEEETDVESVWSSLKHGSIEGIADPDDNWSPMAYIFRCLKCGEIVTIWDAE